VQPESIRFEVFAAVTMKNTVFWDVAPCSSCVNRRFGRTYRLHLQGRKIRERGTRVCRWLQTERQSKATSYIRTGREGEWATWESIMRDKGKRRRDGRADSMPEPV
jgi:hypothetical protein